MKKIKIEIPLKNLRKKTKNISCHFVGNTYFFGKYFKTDFQKKAILIFNFFVFLQKIAKNEDNLKNGPKKVLNKFFNHNFKSCKVNIKKRHLNLNNNFKSSSNIKISQMKTIIKHYKWGK